MEKSISNCRIITASADGLHDPDILYGDIVNASAKGLEGWLVFPQNHASNFKAHINGIPVFYPLKFTGSYVDIDTPTTGRKHHFILEWKEIPDLFKVLLNDTNLSLILEHNGKSYTFEHFRKVPRQVVKAALSRFAPQLQEAAPSLVWNDIWGKYNELLPSAPRGDVKLLAYYLPQFHPVRENNEWWGVGFTDWENVVQGKPNFRGHYQPHIPADLGFYDLRLADVRQRQADMARDYGVHGFCYYYYWFDGRKILERPIEEMAASGKPDFPFCICWVNQSWKKTWYTRNEEVLLEIKRDSESEKKFIHSVLPLLMDKRYIRIDDAPLLQIYRATNLADPIGTFRYWRQVCRDHGIPDLHISGCDTKDTTNWAEMGFDSASEFPPIGLHEYCPLRKPAGLAGDFTGAIYSYPDLVGAAIQRKRDIPCYYPGVAVAWDNTPRYRRRSLTFVGACPEWYEVWLRSAMFRARATLPSHKRYVFLFAWNEWAEGAYLEPDRAYGYKWLEATRRAAYAESNLKEIIKLANAAPKPEAGMKPDLVQSLENNLAKMANLLGDDG